MILSPCDIDIDLTVDKQSDYIDYYFPWAVGRVLSISDVKVDGEPAEVKIDYSTTGWHIFQFPDQIAEGAKISFHIYEIAEFEL